MKIVLRKVKAQADGDDLNLNRFNFVPLNLPKYSSAVSMSMGTAYYVSMKYGLDFDDYRQAENEITFNRRKNVFQINKENTFLYVPTTLNTTLNKSTKKYANQICDYVAFKKYLHFTHFGFLKQTFPKSQIQCILEIFLSKNNIDCEVCWEIDEKYFDEMKSVLAEAFSNNNYEYEFEAYDVDSFRWDDAYRNLCDVRTRERNEARLVQLRLNSQTSSTNGDVRNQQERRNMATRQPTDNVHIGTTAAGNAGEYYALSVFIRNGFIAGKAPEGTSTYDLLVMTSDSFSFKPVQVKTITNGQHWLLSRRHEDVIENLIFCFVKFFDISTLPKLYLIPSSVVSEVISKCHEIYVTLPGVRGERNRNSPMRTLMTDFSVLIENVENPQQYLNQVQLNFLNEHSFGWLDTYENNFDIFN